MRIRLDIEYDGTDYFGWQRQPGVPTIQRTLEDTLEVIEGKKTPVHGAGRTDSGVHALGQVAHFDSQSPIPPERWKKILDGQLPRAIRILQSREVPSTFDAQRKALWKRYEYRVLNRTSGPAFERWIWAHHVKLDWARVAEAGEAFVGRHDFKAFQGAGASLRSTERTIRRFELKEEQNGYYRFIVEGDGFLKQMVRAMVGTLVEIGELKRDPKDIGRVLASKDRREAGRTVPASGLCLTEVIYGTDSAP